MEILKGKHRLAVDTFTHFGLEIQKTKPQDGWFQVFEEDSGRLVDQQLVVNGEIFAFTPLIDQQDKFKLWDQKIENLHTKEEVERLAKLISFQ